MTSPLFLAVFVVATCGLIYELILGSLASYILGDSVTQFSTIIGFYLFSMGIGSYLARFISRGLIQKFVQIEIAVGLVGGISAVCLFLIFSFNLNFRPALYTFVFIIGTLVGAEIPLLLRILKDRLDFKELVSKVLALDYIGALAASLLFPILLVPKLGLIHSSILFGALNVSVGVWLVWIFREKIPGYRYQMFYAVSALLFLISGFFWAERLTKISETWYYGDPIIISERSRYQKIVVTRWEDDIRLYLNNQLQFASSDEYRYHESLVFPALLNAKSRDKVLILGGGDGLAAREVLKIPDVKEITLVDLDGRVTDLFSQNTILRKLNGDSLLSPKVRIVNTDAFLWLKENKRKFDVIIIDLPDPSNFSIGKMYTSHYFKVIKSRLSEGGIVVMQSTSPYYARKSFWCVVHSAQAAGWETRPYHVHLPSFGVWGYVMLTHSPVKLKHDYPKSLKFLTEHTAKAMFHFPADMAEVPTEVHNLNNQVLVHYYEREWQSANR